MKIVLIAAIAALAILAAALLAVPRVTPPSPSDPDLLYQVSVIDALMQGGYDGVVPVGELMRHGDFGLGTFDALDGEMVVLDGTCYRVGMDGVAQPGNAGLLVPYADITTFDRETVIPGISGGNLSGITAALDAVLPSENYFLAIRIDATFPAVTARSVPRQEKPYPPLTEAVSHQAVFQWYNITGTVVGFYSPPYTEGIDVTGYHLHFLSSDRQKGGHLLDLAAENATVVLDMTPRFTVILPESGDFTEMDLSEDLSEETALVEK